MALLTKLGPWMLAAVLASGCAPRTMRLTPDHPANPAAEPGRLVGGPSALRAPGGTPEPPPSPEAAPPPTGHEGHH